MDCSELVLNVIKEPIIKDNINPVLYYSIKHVYSTEFSKRSRYFCAALKKLFDDVNETLKIDNILSLINHNEVDEDVQTNSDTMDDINKSSNELDVVFNEIKKSEDSSNNLLNKFNIENDNHLINKLLEYDETYILDKEDEYLLLFLIRDYVLSSVDASLSELMQGYNIFVSSVELIFCMKLVLKFPNLSYSKLEQKHQQKYYDYIYQRVKIFFLEWKKLYPNKYKKNKLIQ